MNISSKGRYALQAIFDLASQPIGEPVKIAGIARRQSIPQKFLELILASLKQGGFVESRRGTDGGYYLAQLAENITVGEVLRYIDGASPLEPKGLRHETPFSDLWQTVDRNVADILDHANFAAIVRDWGEKRRTYVPDWDI